MDNASGSGTTTTSATDGEVTELELSLDSLQPVTTSATDGEVTEIELSSDSLQPVTTSATDGEVTEIELSSDSLQPVLSVLDHLKSPTASDLSRKRKIPCNPPKGMTNCNSIVASEPVKVCPSDRVKECPNQRLSVVSDIQPSSAAVELVFSILTNFFTERQTQSL